MPRLPCAPVLLLLSVLLCSCGSGTVAPVPVAAAPSGLAALDPNTRATELQAALDQAMAEGSVPGAVVGVWTPAGQWTLARGQASVAAGRAADRGDASAIRSITKSFTVTLVLQLVGEGRIGLDDPIGRFVPGVRGGDRITVRQLAGMTSGLFDYTRDPGLAEALQTDPLRTFPVEELLGFTYRHPLQFEPGSAYQYCNSNTLILGQLVEAVTGQAFEAVLQSRILQPLGMQRTVYLSGVDIPQPAMLGYLDAAPGQPEEIRVNFTALGAAGALASTLDDCHTWAVALGSGSLLPAAVQQERLRFRPATNGPLYDQYGLGIGEIRGWLGHTGEGLGYEACVFYDPGSGSAVVILLNASNRKDVPALLFQQFLNILGQ